jgi:hypothetical protein
MMPGAKRLGLLHELLPGATRFALLVQEGNFADYVIPDLRSAASTLGFQIEIISAGNNRDIDVAFATLPQMRADVLANGQSTPDFWGTARSIRRPPHGRQRDAAVNLMSAAPYSMI